jgi:hypothetical protein
MAMPSSDAPAWLFSFVDLAFLLLIAMTQIGGSGTGPELGEISVPRIQAGSTTELVADAPRLWQLRIHPPDAATAPFELVRPDAVPGATARRLAPQALREELLALRTADARKPLLAPHADSRSQDLLDAVGLVEELWPSRRRATVAPIFARR